MSVHIKDCDGWWLSCCRVRALVARARGVLGSTSGTVELGGVK